MSRFNRSLLLVCSLAFLSSCAAITPEVRRGAPGPALRRVVLLPASCSDVDGACDRVNVAGVQGIVENELAFAGLSVIDAETLVAKARTRDEHGAVVQLFGLTALEAAHRRQTGSIFQDLTPEQRRALLDEAGADGLVSVRVIVGARDGMSPARKNEVLIRMGRGHYDDLAWVTRCRATSGFNPPVNQAVETAARCALGGVRGMESARSTEP